MLALPWERGQREANRSNHRADRSEQTEAQGIVAEPNHSFIHWKETGGKSMDEKIEKGPMKETGNCAAAIRKEEVHWKGKRGTVIGDATSRRR